MCEDIDFVSCIQSQTVAAISSCCLKDFRLVACDLKIDVVSIMTGEACYGLTSEASCGSLPMVGSRSVRWFARASANKANRANIAGLLTLV